MCEQGLIVPHISEVFQFEDVNEALNYVKEQKSTGKVILEVIKPWTILFSICNFIF